MSGIRAEGVRKVFGRFETLSSMSLEVREEEHLVLLSLRLWLLAHV